MLTLKTIVELCNAIIQWFHVDDLSSAHVYLRLKSGQTMDDIPEDCLTDCCSLVKANSIQGCKKSEVYIVYTRWKVSIIISGCDLLIYTSVKYTISTHVM